MKLYTIKSPNTISDLFKNGIYFSNRYITFIIKNENDILLDNKKIDNFLNFAFIAGKKNGNAVWRASSKRRLRSIAYDLFNMFPNTNIILLAKKEILNDSYSHVLNESEKTIKSARKQLGFCE